MSTLASQTKAAARRVRVTDEALTVELVDGRVVSVPTTWYPRLADASSRERRSWVLIGAGIGIHWTELDEDISVEGLLRGEHSGESLSSLRACGPLGNGRRTRRCSRRAACLVPNHHSVPRLAAERRTFAARL